MTELVAISTLDTKPSLSYAQLKIIELKKRATEEIIRIIEANLFNGNHVNDQLFLSAKESTPKLYKYLTEESPLKDDFSPILNSFDNENHHRYIFEVVANVARYLVSSEDYNNKIEVAHQNAGLKRRKLPLALHSALVSCLPDCQGFTTENRPIWDIEAIKSKLEEEARSLRIEINLEFFTSEYLHKYLVRKVFPYHPQLRYSRVINEAFWQDQDNIEALHTFTKQTSSGVVRNYADMIQYIFEKTGVIYLESTLKEKLSKYGIHIARSGLSSEEVNSNIERLRKEGKVVNWSSLSRVLEVEPSTLKKFCESNGITVIDRNPRFSIEDIRSTVIKLRKEGEIITWLNVAEALQLTPVNLTKLCNNLKISIIDEEEVMELIRDLEAQCIIVTSKMVAEKLGYSFNTIDEELGEKEGFKTSLRNAITKAISRIKNNNTEQRLTYHILTKAVATLLEADCRNVRIIMVKNSIPIFSSDEIDEAVCNLKEPEQSTLEDIASTLRTDLSTLLRDIKILNYDLSLLGIRIEG